MNIDLVFCYHPRCDKGRVLLMPRSVIVDGESCCCWWRWWRSFIWWDGWTYDEWRPPWYWWWEGGGGGWCWWEWPSLAAAMAAAEEADDARSPVPIPGATGLLAGRYILIMSLRWSLDAVPAPVTPDDDPEVCRPVDDDPDPPLPIGEWCSSLMELDDDEFIWCSEPELIPW